MIAITTNGLLNMSLIQSGMIDVRIVLSAKYKYKSIVHVIIFINDVIVSLDNEITGELIFISIKVRVRVRVRVY